MYGYIKPQTSELKVREHLFYKSIYCGLCRSLSKHTGGFSSMTLSYDMTFFAIMRMIIKDEKPNIKKKNCILHPFSKRNIAQNSKELEYTAYVSSVLSHEKIKDNIEDEKFFKKFISILIYPFTSYFKRKNKIKYINEIASEHLNQLKNLENNKCPYPDEVANCFGNICSKLLSYDVSDEKSQRIASNIGFHIGRFIYLSDAICDYEKDKKQNKYNPFIYSLNDENEIKYFFENGYKIVLSKETREIKSSFDLLVGNNNSELISCANNIIDLGMMSNVELAISKRKGESDNGKSI